MTIQKKSRLYLIAKAAVSLLLLGFIFSGLNNLTNIVNTELPEEARNLNRAVIIKYLSDQTLYYDEVLTQSCRNYVFTQNPKWKFRYEKNEELLEAIIKEAMRIGDERDQRNFEKLSEANVELVRLEEKAFTLVDAGVIDEAKELLEGDEYWDLKEEYVESVNEYLTSQDIQVTTLLGSVEGLITEHSEKERDLAANLKVSFLLYILIFLGLTWTFSFLLVRLVLRHVYTLKKGAEIVKQGNFDHVIQINSGDEFQDLAHTFNAMAANLNEMTQKVNLEALQRELINQRNHFSRELHDRLGIIVSSIKLQLERLKPEGAEASEKGIAFSTCQQLVNEAYSQIREITHNPIPESIVQKGLKGSLDLLFARTEMIFQVQTKLITNVSEDSFSNAEKSSLYSLIREMLNNAIKYSKGSIITCQIIDHDDHILVMFEDDGVGFEVEEKALSNGQGLKNMRERVSELGGTMYIESKPSFGTTISIELSKSKPKPSHAEDQTIDL